MTIEYAMKILDDRNRTHYFNTAVVNEACRMGREALEKQIPKKPKIKKLLKNIDGFMLRCPNCEAVLQSDTPHCKYCGQALDWSDNE